MKTKKIILIMIIACTYIFSKKSSAQNINLKELTIKKNLDAPVKNKASSIDKNLVITSPLLGKNVIGKLNIVGKANLNSTIKIEVTATYYKYAPDSKTKKLNKGEGPFEANAFNKIIKANAAGIWSTTPVNFNNYGYSTTFKIVVRSVEGKNATYITVQNNTLPNIAWD
jgi:hypothetical protein